MEASNLRARFFAPPGDLAGCFTSFYLFEVKEPDGARIDDFLHPEWGNLRFFQGATTIARMPGNPELAGTPFTATGPSSCPTWFSLANTRMWGVGLLPLGWARFMDVPARSLADTLNDGRSHPAFARFVPLFRALESAWEASEEEQADLIRDFFLALDRKVREAPRIEAIHEALVDADVNSAADLADRACVSTKTLARYCDRWFGFPPQLLIRRQRMMRTLAAFMLSEKPTWSEVIDAHYTDHAHFTHEFQAFMHMSPSDYAARDHPVLSAFMAERARVLGSPVQTLDAPGGSRDGNARTPQ